MGAPTIDPGRRRHTALDAVGAAWQNLRVIRETTLAGAVTLSGPGLHCGRFATVTLHPAAAGFGRRVAGRGAREAVAMTADHWIASRMSTSIALGEGRSVRTIEHMMAALTAHGIDNVRVDVDGTEIPILDGSAGPWCRRLREVGAVPLEAPRRAIEIRAPLQVVLDGGFLRVEPGSGFAVDVTHDVLPGFPVMRWRGAIDPDRFDADLAASRSFGNLHRRLGFTPKMTARATSETSVVANRPDPGLERTAAQRAIALRDTTGDAGGPLLRGWRPWRAALVVGGRIVPWARFPDEPVRHVTLDMIGDLALAGAPLIGRVVAHNPSHFKTYALVKTLMADRAAWAYVDGRA